jgi:small-conductance mechanosensitive channel
MLKLRKYSNSTMQRDHTDKNRLIWRLVLLGSVLISSGAIAFSQNGPTTNPGSSEVIHFLDQTINWYHQLSVEQQIATEPNDLMVVLDNRQVADQVVRLSFDFARAETDALAKRDNSGPTQSEGAASSQYEALHQLQASLDKQAQDAQAELDANRQKLATATGSKHQAIQSRVEELQGELELVNARRDAVRSMVEFVNGTSANGLGGTGLKAQVEALAGSVPVASANPSSADHAGASPPNALLNPSLTSTTNKPELSGIWDLTADIFALSRKVSTLDSVIQQTDALANASRQIRTPLVSSLKALSGQGDQLASEADTANQSALGQEKDKLDTLAKQFKQLSAAVVPLSKQSILLELYRRSLTNWQDTIKARYKTELRYLGIRLAFLALILGMAFGTAELWRRAVDRYVRDPRRRYQFLLLRRFVLWFVIAIIIAFAFASRLGSIVTFAGLLTAGVAVALQNVILSIVGYFFLIGKFGIRVGDRVQIGGVTGEVIDIGLVRLHLMELGGGADGPTGRVVAFSNSIVFQPSAGLFKQIPGTSFVWHEITLMLSPDTDYNSVKERLLEAVKTVLADYHDEMERQNREMEKALISTSGYGLQPSVQLRFSLSAVEATIRFPVDLQHASETDERVSRELLRALDREPQFKLAASGSPSIRLRTDLAAGAASG